ncbi:universal stress protein [Halostagnicola sp. A-GB9-2]|uniref:universal stress protein n=1 Tax=Halostagnicola sp. A-GB9-2 TaxID=3048066 RepID=UPI0024BFFF17|nr:universal stress protein [Halostagnicola sp. A-GB9-2]MDJ1433994.1 universal stress protein [Halostagnicola sp. A-GB9-2]
MAILCAIDDDHSTEAVLTTADDLARAFDDELVVLSVMTEDRFEARAKNQPEYYVDDAAREAQTTARETAGDVLESTDRVVARGRVGDPAEEILEVAERLPARYLVVGGRKRSPVGKALFGSVTQSILLGASSPVVAVMSEQ